MEMPEGLKRLSNETNSWRGQLGMDMDSALNFMKEMAEVIEYTIGPTRDVKIPKLKAVLDKFKGWK